MDKNIVAASLIFGAAIIIASIASSKIISEGIQQAGANARSPHVSVPSGLAVTHYFNTSGQTHPIQIELSEGNETNNDVQPAH